MSESGPDAEAVVGAAGGDGEADTQIGLAEASARAVLGGEWDQITITQTGPDGTEVIGMVVFFACPICFAAVPPPTQQRNFPNEHANHHFKVARDWDYVNAMVAAYQAAGG